MWRSANAKSVFCAAALLGGCSTRAAEPVVSRTPRFDPIAFFSGRTQGDGRLKILLKAEQQVRVQGQGRVEPDGTLVLEQVVRRGTRRVERREWRMREIGPDRYRGTLSDAIGTVDVETYGSLLTIRYAMKGGLRVEQSLYLDATARSALNRMKISKLGVPVARLEETIRKLD